MNFLLKINYPTNLTYYIKSCAVGVIEFEFEFELITSFTRNAATAVFPTALDVIAHHENYKNLNYITHWWKCAPLHQQFSAQGGNYIVKKTMTKYKKNVS